MNQCVAPALHVSYGWLAYVLFHAYHLDACEQKSLGKHAYLSSWRLRYGLNDMIFAPYCLSAWEIYLKICKTFAKLLFDMPKSYQSHMTIQFENLIHICCLSCIELCQIVVTLERILFMLSWSRFTCTPYTPFLCFFEKLALYHPLISQKRREAWAIKTNIYGHMKVQV